MTNQNFRFLLPKTILARLGVMAGLAGSSLAHAFIPPVQAIAKEITDGRKVPTFELRWHYRVSNGSGPPIGVDERMVSDRGKVFFSFPSRRQSPYRKHFQWQGLPSGRGPNDCFPFRSAGEISHHPIHRRFAQPMDGRRLYPTRPTPPIQTGFQS